MSEDREALEQRVAELEDQVTALQGRGYRKRCVRKRSGRRILGVPLYDIACGPDPKSGELMGHARGIVAIGDEALGVFALGGLARGLFAFGGLAIGGVTFGGCSIGLLLAIGGAAIGGIAVGGAAVGVIAVGGAAVGYLAVGGGAFGKYVISAAHRSPEAIEFFRRVGEALRSLAG